MIKNFLIWLLEKIKEWLNAIKKPEKPIESTHAHAYSSIVISPTCTEGGYTLHKCECGDSYTDSVTAPLGHEEETDEGYPATCVKEGLTNGSHCKRCGEVLKVHEKITPKGHVEGDWFTTIAATCVTAGEKN